MIEVYRTNDPVKLSWLQALLRDAGIESLVFDHHASIIEGSIGAIQRRLMVIEEDEHEARHLIEASERQEAAREESSRDEKISGQQGKGLVGGEPDPVPGSGG